MRNAVKYLPNATAGKEYVTELERLGGLPPLRIVFGSLSGFAYEPETGKLRGCPTGSGEYELYVLYDDARPELNQKYRLIVNPNPSDLWKSLPSGEDDAKFAKLCGDATLLGGMRRGRLHAHHGRPSDDAFEIAVWKNAYFAAVADGAGSAKDSRKAARCVVSAAVGEALRCFQNGSDVGKAVEAGVEAALSALGLLERRSGTVAEEAYTTLALFCAVKSADVWHVGVFNVGDGAVALIYAENFCLLTEKDSGEYSGQTLFLQHEPHPKARITLHAFDSPVFLLMATDGLLDPLGLHKNANIQNWMDLKQTMLKELELDGEKLVDWLGFYARGHFDDRTLVVLTDE